MKGYTKGIQNLLSFKVRSGSFIEVSLCNISSSVSSSLIHVVFFQDLQKEKKFSTEEGRQVSCVLYPSGPPRNAFRNPGHHVESFHALSHRHMVDAEAEAMVLQPGPLTLDYGQGFPPCYLGGQTMFLSSK